MPLSDCKELHCSLTLHHGWNTWTMARALEPGKRITSDDLKGEIDDLIHGELSVWMPQRWLPSRDARELTAATFLAPAQKGRLQVDEQRYSEALATLRERSFKAPGIPGVVTLSEACHQVTMRYDTSTLVLVDFWWDGPSETITWPGTRYLWRPLIPGITHSMREARACDSDLDWVLVEAWGAAPTAERPPTLLERSTRVLGEGAKSIVAGVTTTYAASGLAFGVGVALVAGFYLMRK